MDGNFESRLINAPQPTGDFAMAQGIHHFFPSVFFDRMTRGPQYVQGFADSLERDSQQAALHIIADARPRTRARARRAEQTPVHT